jgi:hypothetical protein
VTLDRLQKLGGGKDDQTFDKEGTLLPLESHA